MLINLSNHPYSKWSEQQYKSAIENYTEIKDIPFPVIDPYNDAEEVLLKAKEYMKLCIDELSEYPGQRNAVHIMGEFNFTYILVSALLSKKIECITSTTERNVVDDGDRKITVFKFVKFREYVNYND